MTGDPFLPFIPRPGSVIRGTAAGGEFDYEYRHNSAGFRDVEHAAAAESGVFRILGLGDSFTYGVGARFEDTYLCRLESRLNERQGEHPRVEIIKAGIPRYYPETERILLEKYGARYAPDLILIGFCPNDVIDTHLGPDAIVVDERSGTLLTREAAALGGWARALYNHSHVCRIILRRYIDYRISRRSAIHWSDLSKDDGYYEEDWRAIEDEYARIATIGHKIGALVFVVHIPAQGPWSDADGYAPRRLQSWAVENGAGFVDVMPALLHEEQKTLYYARDGHCTPDGYAAIAAAVFDHLIEANAVP